MNTIIKRKKGLIISFVIALFLYTILDFDFSIKMSITLSLLVISWWAADVVDRTVAALFYVFTSFLLHLAPPEIIFRFPLTANFYIIIFSFIISEGVVKSGLAEYTVDRLMKKIVKTPIQMILFSYLAGVLLIFFIPQPFPRVILLSVFYMEFFKKQRIKDGTKSVLFFSIYTAATFTSMMFLNGDLLLHYVAMEMGNIDLNWGQWTTYLAIPSIIVCILTFFLFIFVFRKDIRDTKFDVLEKDNKKSQMTNEQKKTVIILIIIFILFSTQAINGMKSQWIMLLGVLGMYFLKIVDVTSVKKVNWKLLIFFVAAFSIGGILTYSGAVEVLCEHLLKLMPQSSFSVEMIFIIFIIMILHMILGSAVTTSSVALPVLINMGVFEPKSAVLTLIVYTVVNMHYLLPFHHATIMIGFGQNLYSSKHVLRYGLWLTILTFITVMLLEVPWWKFIGLM